MTAPDLPPSSHARFVVEIGPKEIYDKLLELTTEVRVMVGDQAEIKDTVKDHEDRIRAVEKRQLPLPILSVVIALVAVLLAAFPNVAK